MRNPQIPKDEIESALQNAKVLGQELKPATTLESLLNYDPNKELSAGIQRRQDQIQYIMEQENPAQTKDLITIAQEFKELVNLDEIELRTRYLSKKYPDYYFTLNENGLVTRHVEEWSLPAWDAFLAALVPSLGIGAAPAPSISELLASRDAGAVSLRERWPALVPAR